MTDVGRDDFADHLHFNDGALLTRIRAAVEQDYQWFVLHIHADEISFRFAPAAETPPRAGA